MNSLWAIGLFSAVIAAGVSSLLMILNSWRERVAANQRHLRELAMQTALEAFKNQQWAYEHLHDPTRQMHFLPIDYFFLHYLNLANVVGGGKPLTTTQFRERIARVDDLRPELRSWAVNLRNIIADENSPTSST